MNQIKALLQPFLFGGVHPGQGSRKVRFILCPHVLCLEQQHDCRLQVRQAVRGDCESFTAWAADARIAPADPHVSVTRFQHHVGAPAVFCCVQTPYLEHVRPWLPMRRQKLDGSAGRGAELQREQRPAKKRQVAADDCEFYIFMIPGLAAMPQIQRPSPGYGTTGLSHRGVFPQVHAVATLAMRRGEADPGWSPGTDPEQQPADRQHHISAEEQGERPAEAGRAEQIHADTDGLRPQHHADAVAQHEGGIGGCQFMP